MLTDVVGVGSFEDGFGDLKSFENSLLSLFNKFFKSLSVGFPKFNVFVNIVLIGSSFYSKNFLAFFLFYKRNRRKSISLIKKIYTFSIFSG